MNALTTWLRRPGWLTRRHDDLRLETKQAINPLIALQGLAEASWGEGSYAGLSRDGYLANPVVHRCVRMIAEAAGSMPWLLYEAGEELQTHPLLDLLNRPNPWRPGAAFFDSLYCGLLIAGNAYVQRIDLEGQPRELHLLRADRISLLNGEDGWPEAYEYAVNGRKTRFEAGGANAPLLHLSLYNPLDDFEGTSPLRAAHMALEIHNAASRWNKALLDNSARPSGALVYSGAENTNLTDEQFERLKGELEDGYTGANRAGRPMLLEGGLDWKPMGFSPKDMDFMDARNGAARDIALAFGVPPMLLGIPGDNTYSNYQEANRAFWRQTVLPLVLRVAAALQNWLGPAWAEGLRLDVDRDAIEALSADRDALWKRVNEAQFLSDDEKREATGYGRLDDDAAL